MGQAQRAVDAGRSAPWLYPSCAALAVLLVVGGCTRVFYRHQADKEVSEVLADKDRYPAWHIEQYHIYPDPRSRFADPSDPDHPPMPPDDPAAWKLSPHPQKVPHAGVQWIEGTGYLEILARWDRENRQRLAAEQKAEASRLATEEKTNPSQPPAPAKEKANASQPPAAEKPNTPPAPAAEKASPAPPAAEQKTNPDNQPPAEGTSPGQPATAEAGASAPCNPGGSTATLEEVRNLAQPSQPYLLTMDQAVELGVINSRDYQDQRDNLYLTALPVTLERFAFAAQFEALGSIFREWLGREVTGGPANDWRFQTTTGFTKLFSTGALLLFQFANTTVINITHPFGQEAVTSQSTITLDLIQPLLRGGGRAVTLEPLTQAERNLLYEIRDFAHFRKGFYAYITAGVNLPTGSIVTPSALARAILPTSVASTTVGVSGTTIAPVVSPGAGAPSNPIFPPIPPSAGFLPTLVFRAQIDVDRGNVTTLERFLKLFTALKEGGDVSELQVENVEQALLGGQTQVLSDELSYGNFLDQLKLQLGVPTSLPLELDSSMLRPITHQFDRFERVLSEYDAVQAAAAALAAEPVARLRPRLHELATSAALVRGTPFRTAFPGRWAAWERLSDKEVAQRLAQERAERRKVLDQRAELESADKPVPASLQQRQDQLDADIDLGLFEQALRDYEAQPWRALPDAEARRRAQASYFRLVINAFTVVIGAARNERLLQIRESWPDLPPSCVSGLDLIQADQDRAMTMVAQTALVNRLDLMNDRAQLMDAWRRIAVAANALLGTLNVQYNLNSFTPPGQAKPFAFGDGRNTNQIIFNWQLPLVRIVERNNYRSSLIAYQRQRRALMAEEDFVLDAVRTDLRQLRLAAEQYRIQKRAVELAYAQVENSLDTFRAPPTPLTQAGGNMQATAAALTTQLLGAQSALRTAQTQMLTFFLNYLTYRVQLYTDLELLPLDNRGVWTDDVATCQCPPEHPARRAAEGSGGRPEGAGSERQGEQRPEQLPEPVPAPPGPALDAGR